MNKAFNQCSRSDLTYNKILHLPGGCILGYLQGVKELSTNTIPSKYMVDDLNPGPPNYRSSTLAKGLRRLKYTQ